MCVCVWVVGGGSTKYLFTKNITSLRDKVLHADLDGGGGRREGEGEEITTVYNILATIDRLTEPCKACMLS